MQLFSLTIAAQIDPVMSVLGVVAAIALSFIAITLVASYYRFQNIVQQAEESNPEEMGATAAEVLRVQLARFLAGCARKGTSFTMAFIRITEPGYTLRMDSPIISALKTAARKDDVACLFSDEIAVLLLESEPEDGISILNRITADVLASGKETSKEILRVGLASYPGHGLSGKDLIAVAAEGLESATPEEPIIMPEIVEVDEEDEDEIEEEPAVNDLEADGDVATFELDDEEDEEDDEDEKSKGWKERRKSSMLDELTGVLKPSAISAYMQRTMSELRREKKAVSLFCIGLNNMDHIARFHGNDAADDVMAGVSKVLQDNLRTDDLIGRHEKYAYLVLAECTLEEAEFIGRRITTLVQQTEYVSENKKLKTTITLGVAAYPQHGRNLHHLYMAGQKVLDYSRINDIRGYAVYDAEIHDKVPSKPMKSIKSIQA